jgi:hypothetical protein
MKISRPWGRPFRCALPLLLTPLLVALPSCPLATGSNQPLFAAVLFDISNGSNNDRPIRCFRLLSDTARVQVACVAISAV